MVDLDRAFGDGDNLKLVRAHRGAGRRPGASAGRWRFSDGRASLREGLEQGVTRAGDRYRRAIDPAIVPAAVAAWAPSGSPWASMRVTAWSRCAAGPRRSELTAGDDSRGAWWPRGSARSSTPTWRATGCSPAPTSTARAAAGRRSRVIASGGVSGAGDLRAVARGGAGRRDRRARALRGPAHAGRGARGSRAGTDDDPPRLVVLALAAALAAFTYLWLERTGRRGWVPLACRAVAWGALGLLLLNVSCPVAGTLRRPLVLLDALAQPDRAGGRWPEARDSAARWGDVRRFGDERGRRRYAAHARTIAARARAHRGLGVGSFGHRRHRRRDRGRG